MCRNQSARSVLVCTEAVLFPHMVTRFVELKGLSLLVLCLSPTSGPNAFFL